MPVVESLSDNFTGFVPPDPKAIEAERASIEYDLGNRYIISRFIARGGFASVWQAWDRIEASWVAVKQLHPRIGRGRDFFRELRAMFVLQHPHIVRIINFLETSGTRYLILELCPGGTLRGMISRARKLQQAWPDNRVATIIFQLAQGLSEAHRLGFTHRDLKPENILFAEQNDELFGGSSPVKLADFGLATWLSTPDSSGQLRGLTGSPAYMAPEQFSSCFSPASDLYALGVIAYELILGDLPFYGSPEELARQHLYESPTFPDSLTEPWASLLPRLLAKSATVRPSACEVAKILAPLAQAPAVRHQHSSDSANVPVPSLPRLSEARAATSVIIRPVKSAAVIYAVHPQGLEPWSSQNDPGHAASLRLPGIAAVYPEEDGSLWLIADRRIVRYDSEDHIVWEGLLPAAMTSVIPFLHDTEPRAVGWREDELVCVALMSHQVLWRKVIPNAGMKRYSSRSIAGDQRVAVTDLDGSPGLRIIRADGTDLERLSLPGIVRQLGAWPGCGGWFLRLLSGSGFEAVTASPEDGCQPLADSSGVAILAQRLDAGPLVGVWPNRTVASWSKPDSRAETVAVAPTGKIRALTCYNQTIAALIEDSDHRSALWSVSLKSDSLKNTGVSYGQE